MIAGFSAGLFAQYGPIKMVKIPEIIITDAAAGYFVEKKFLWSSITPFSVITGINGSGKTKLLEHVANSHHYTNSCLIRYIDVYYKPPLQKHANELAAGYSQSLLNEDGKYYGVTKDGQRTDRISSMNHFKNSNVLATLDYAIIDNIVKDRKIFQNNTTQIRDELDRTDKYITTFDIKDLLPTSKNNDQPWDRIDRILSAFGLLIRIDRMNLIAGLEFLRRSKSSLSETTLEMKDLSSGEKVAFALALWTWGNSKGQKTDILLVDEFDAHLNPSIAEKYIGIIKEYFVDLGVQVIMTTHNPSTVAYANGAGADIIWMEDGVIDSEMGYENIIQVLSNGLIDINYLTEEIQLLIQNKDRCVIYTEGKTDQKHIESAILALGRQNEFEKYYVFGCTGADTAPFFAGLQTGQHKRIVLLDSDEKGKKVFQKIMDQPDLMEKINQGKLAVIFVSPEDDKVIEDLFDSKLHMPITSKVKFAARMALPVHQTAINFANFTSLLDKLLSFSNWRVNI